MEFKEILSKSFGENYNNLPDAVKEVIDNDLVSRVEYLLDEVNKVKSPIEQIMLAKLNCELSGIEAYLNSFMHWKHEELFKYSNLSIGEPIPQFKIDNYRVDFMIPITITVKSMVITHNIVIECDGYEYHYSTPEIILKDKKRQKDIEKQGYKVLRFLGKEIVNNADSCMSEFAELCESLYYSEVFNNRFN